MENWYGWVWLEEAHGWESWCVVIWMSHYNFWLVERAELKAELDIVEWCTFWENDTGRYVLRSERPQKLNGVVWLQLIDWRFDVCRWNVMYGLRCRNLQSPFYYWDLWRFGLGDCSFHSEEGTNWRGIHTKCFRVVEGKTSEAVLPGSSSSATERWLNYGFGIRNILTIWMKWCLASDLE